MLINICIEYNIKKISKVQEQLKLKKENLEKIIKEIEKQLDDENLKLSF